MIVVVVSGFVVAVAVTSVDQYCWSGTPPVETKTSRNTSCSNNRRFLRGNHHKLHRILQFSTTSCRIECLFTDFCGHLQNSGQIVVISVKILRFFANIFVSTGFCFDWWRPAWNLYDVA